MALSGLREVRAHAPRREKAFHGLGLQGRLPGRAHERRVGHGHGLRDQLRNVEAHLRRQFLAGEREPPRPEASRA